MHSPMNVKYLPKFSQFSYPTHKTYGNPPQNSSLLLQRKFCHWY